MKMRMTNVPFQTPRFSPLVLNSTRESLSIMEKNHAIDLTGFVIMCLDVWYGKTSNFSWFTRCGVDVTSFRIMDWSKNLGVICNDDPPAKTTLTTTTIRKWDAKTRKDIEVEFIDVDISDVNDMINWLRIEKDIFYAPPKDKKADEEKIEAKIEPLSSTFYCCDSKLVTETQRLQEENKKLKKKVAEQKKKIDSYEATLGKITDIMEPRYAGPAWSETWDDLVERIKRMKEKVETLEAENADWMNSFSNSQDSRSAFCKKLKEALNVDYRYPGHFTKMEEDILAEVARLKAEHDDVRGLSLKIEELEEKLKHANATEVWYRRTNREVVMERDRYQDICEEQSRDLQEWAEWFDKVCEDLDTPERDLEEVFSVLRGKLIELDDLSEFKAKLAEVIKLPEDKKGTATTEDYISSFEHTKGEWRKMEIKLANYEREIRLLNDFLEEKKKELGASNGAMDVLRSIHGSIIGLCDIDDSPQIIGARIIDRFNRERKRMRELEQKLDDIKDICDGDTDVMNIIGE